jgi:hypothetical protein
MPRDKRDSSMQVGISQFRRENLVPLGIETRYDRKDDFSSETFPSINVSKLTERSRITRC